MCTLYQMHPLQGDTPLHLAVRENRTACVEHLLSTPGIDVNIKNRVSWSTDYYKNKICTGTCM